MRDGDEILVSKRHGRCFRLDTADCADGLPGLRRERLVLDLCVLHCESDAGEIEDVICSGLWEDCGV